MSGVFHGRFGEGIFANEHNRMTEIKYNHQAGPVELASPTPGQQSFTAELEAPIKAPR